MVPLESSERFEERPITSSCVGRKSATSRCRKRSASSSTPSSRSSQPSAIKISSATTIANTSNQLKTFTSTWSTVAMAISVALSEIWLSRASAHRSHLCGAFSRSWLLRSTDAIMASTLPRLAAMCWVSSAQLPSLRRPREP